MTTSTATIHATHAQDDLSLESAFNHPVLARYTDNDGHMLQPVDVAMAADSAGDELVAELGIQPPQEAEFKSLVAQIFQQSHNVDRALDALWEVVDKVSADVAAENDD